MAVSVRVHRAFGRLGLTALGLLGILGFGCKCAPGHSSSIANQRVTALAASVEQPSKPPLAIESALVALNRARRFAEARALLATLPTERSNSPAYRFVGAYLAVMNRDGASAMPMLEGLEPSFAELAPEIELLRAQAQLQTADALVGAAWLQAHGRKSSWLEAARTLRALGKHDEALTAISKGLNAIEGASPRTSRLLADYHWLRADLRASSTAPESDLEDLGWLALEAPSHPRAKALVETAIDSRRLKLDPSQQLTRLRRLADVGSIERVEVEWQRLAAESPRLASPALASQLRGRARQIARTDQLEGARLLELAADLKSDNATDLRVDAARLYVREGDVERAVAAYDRAARLDRTRAAEAQFYAARALAILGEPERGLERYSQFIQRYPGSQLRKTSALERAYLWLILGNYATAEPELLRLRDEATKRDQKASLLQLAGLAALRMDHRDLAVERWQTVVREVPLGMASLFAAMRLREVSAEIPDIYLRPAPPVRAQPATWSRRTDQLLALGLDELAANAMLSEGATASRSAAGNRVELACQAWRRIGYGERGYLISRSIGELSDASLTLDDNSRWQWDCRYPRPYSVLVEEFETEFRLPSTILYAIMRQESGFDPDIGSPAGAVGLLQLLPTTADRIAQELNYEGEIMLEEPRTNLRLGAAYLRKLLDVFNQNLVLAIAAYNAGPQAVALWLRQAKLNTTEVFAARIPYAETQKYVDRVLSNLLVYRSLSGQERAFFGFSLSLPKELKVSGGLY